LEERHEEHDHAQAVRLRPGRLHRDAVKGGKPVTLLPGQTFYEGPDDVHIVGRNVSSTAPAKFLVVFVKDKGAPILTPVN
jgi:quercetin dioxygenase-like cupin family protein